MKYKKTVALVLFTAMILNLFSGCSNANTISSSNSQSSVVLQTSESSSQSSLSQQSSSQTTATDDLFSAKDMEIGYDESECVKINLQDNSTVGDGTNVKVNSNVITIKSAGTYLVSGSLTQGQIVVDANKTDKVRLIFQSVSITNKSSAPIYVKQADKVYITLDNETENTLEVSGEFVAVDDNNIDAVIFSKADLSINGEGTLTVNTNYGNAITSKDDLIIAGGKYIINASNHGLEGKDSVKIASGDFNITSGKDAIHSENSDDTSLGNIILQNGKYNLTSTNDGIDSSGFIEINGGDFTITTGGGSENASMKENGDFNKDWGNWGGHSNNDQTTSPTIDNNKNNNSGDFNKDWDNWNSNSNNSQTTSATKDSAKNTSATTANTLTVSATAVNSTSDSSTASTSAKAIKADVKITLNAGTFNINSSDDSIHANGGDVIINGGEITIASGDDGIHADSNVTITNGNIKISKSYEGIEGQSIDITGGNIDLTASDDGLNAAGGNDASALGNRPGKGAFSTDENAYIKISGGVNIINASGDGVDSNGNLYVSGGETYVSGPENNGNGALDYNGNAEISGGIFLAAGSSGMAQNFSDTSTQGSIMITTASMQNNEVILKDSKGNVLFNYIPKKQFNNVVISTSDIKQNETYTIVIGDESQTVEMTSIIFGTGGSGMGREPRPDNSNMPTPPNGTDKPPKPNSNTTAPIDNSSSI